LLRVALLRLLRRVLAVALLRWVCAALAVHCAHAKDTPRIACCFPEGCGDNQVCLADAGQV
jgi:hypothetical protein